MKPGFYALLFDRGLGFRVCKVLGTIQTSTAGCA